MTAPSGYAPRAEGDGTTLLGPEEIKMFGWLRRTRPERPRTAAMAMVTLATARLPPPELVRNAAVDLGASSLGLPRHDEASATVTFEVPGGFASYGLLPAPIPAPTLDWPIAVAEARGWRDVREAVAGHAGHLVVVVSSDRLAALDVWILLTKLVGALATTPDAVAVYWGACNSLHEPPAFVAAAGEATPEVLPLDLWLLTFEHPEAPGTFRTVGMDAFGRRDLEVTCGDADRALAPGFLRDVAAYLLTTGAELGDSHTLGFTAEHRVLVSHRPSRWGGPEVYALDATAGGLGSAT